MQGSRHPPTGPEQSSASGGGYEADREESEFDVVVGSPGSRHEVHQRFWCVPFFGYAPGEAWATPRRKRGEGVAAVIVKSAVAEIRNAPQVG